MQYCGFSPKNRDQAVDYVANKLNTVYLNSDVEFKLVPFMKASYKDLVGRTKKDGTKLMSPEKAFTFVKQIPELLAIAGGTKKYRGTLAKEATVIFEMAEDLDTEGSAQKLLKILGLDKSAEDAEREAAERKAKEEEERRKKEQQKKEGERSSEGVDQNQTDYESSTEMDPDTTLSSEIQYVVQKDSKGRPFKFARQSQKSPIQDAVTKFKKAFLRAFAGSKRALRPGQQRQYTSIEESPYELRLMSASKIAEADRIKVEGRDFYSGVIIVYVDKVTGKPVRINAQGEVTENGDYLAHSFFRSPSKLKQAGVNENVVSLHKKIIDTIKNNPDLEYTLEIDGGYLSFSNPVETKKQIKGLKVGQSELNINDFTVETIEIVDKDGNLVPKKDKEGNVIEGEYETLTHMYIDIEGYDYLAKVDANTLMFAQNYIGSRVLFSAVQLLLSNEFDANEKFNALTDFIATTNIKIDGDVISVKTKQGWVEVTSLSEEQLTEALGKLSFKNVITTETINVPVFKDGKADIETVDTIEFIKDNYSAFIDVLYDPNLNTQELASGNVEVKYKRDFNTIREVTKESVAQAEEEVKNPESVDDDVKAQKLKRLKEIREKRNAAQTRSNERISKGNLLNKIDALSSVATKEEIQAAEKWWSSHPLSKYISLNRMFGVVNSGAVATWGNDGITLYAGSNFTDAYHEAWHGFTQLMLTKDEKIALYEEARKIVGDKTYREIEEELAEDFRRYMLSDKKRVFGRSKTINKIFKKILEVLQTLFGARGFITEGLATATAFEAIEDIYEGLASGSVMENRSPSWDNSMFVTLDKGIQVDDNTTMSSANSRYVKEAMDSIIVDLMETLDADVNVLFGDLNNIEDLYAEIKDRLLQSQLSLEEEALELELADTRTKADELKLIELQESIAILEDAIAGYGTFAETKEANPRFSTIGYHLKNSQLMSAFSTIVEEEDEKFELNEDDMINEWREAFDKSGNDVSQIEMMDQRIKLMLSTVPERNQKGETVQDRFGFNKIYSFGKVYNDVQTALAGIQTREDLYDRLIELRKENQKIKESGRRYNNIYEHMLDQIGAIDSPNRNKQLLSSLLWRSFNQAHITNKQIYSSVDNGQFKTVVKDPEGDTSRIRKQIQARFSAANPKGVNYREVFKKYKVGDLNTSSKLYQFLNDLGIMLDYTQELDEYLKSPDVIRSFQMLYEDVSKNLLGLLKKNVESPVKVLSASRKEYQGQSGTIKDLLNFVLSTVPGMSINRKIAADGKNVYDLSQNSTQSQVVKALNSVQTLEELKNHPALKHLHPDNNPYMKGSVWLETLFPNGVKRKGSKAMLKIESFLGVFTEDNASKNMSLTPMSKLVADLHTLFLHGFIEQFRASDKSTSYMLNLNVRLNGSTANKPGLFVPASRKSIHSAMKFFIKKLQADIDTSRRFANAETNIQKHAKNSLGLFGGIIIEGSKDTPEEIIRIQELEDVLAGDISLNDWLVLDSGLNKDGTVRTVQDRLEATIEAYFTSRADQLLSTMDINVLKRMLNKEIAKSTTNNTKFELDFTKNEDVALAVKNLMINDWLINSELAAIFVGDFNQFKDANDFTKRYAVTSTGNLFATDKATQEFINAQGNAYAEKVLGLDPSQTKEYDGTGNTVILTDLDRNLSADGSVLSTNFMNGLYDYADQYNISREEIKEAFISRYKDNYNEADAQAYITLDSYRQLSIASQEWDWNTHEKLYQNIVKAAAEGGEISYQQVVDAAKFFPVRKYQYYGPLLNAEVNGETAHATALHKYSLKPIIPTAKGQKKKAIDIIHDAMVKAQVDYIVFESGSKVNNVNKKVNTYNFTASETDGHVTRELRPEEELTRDFADNINVIHFDYLKDVTKVKDTYKGKSTSSSQMRNLLPIGIYENGKVIPGKEAAAEAYENYLKGTKEYLEVEKEKLLKAFGSRNADNIAAVVKRIKRDLEKREASEEEIEAVEELLVNGGNIDALPNADQIESIITNIINKRLVKAKLVGESLVQVSSAFQETLGEAKTGYSNDLRFYEYADGKISSAQVKIALQGEFVKLLAMNYKGKPIKTLARLNEAIKDEKWLNKGDNRRMITITGVRIPVQGHNSMEVFEVVEFLDPANGTSIVVPSELPVKSGGDFDVDKLTLFFPRLFIGKRKSKDKLDQLTDDLMNAIFGEDGSTNYFVALDKAGQAGAQNEMIKSITDIVLDPSNYLNLIRPNDVNEVKDGSVAYNHYANLNKSKTADEKFVGTALDYLFNTRKLQENSVGKATLGIVAANNVIVALLSRINKALPKIIESGRKGGLFTVNSKDIVLPVDANGLGVIRDSEGKNLKTGIVEQLINGFVDIAKGAWVFNIGATYESTPVLLSMLAAGVNYDYAVAMLNTPLMKEMFKKKAEKKDPLALLLNPKLKTSSPERETLAKMAGLKNNSWKNAERWMNQTLSSGERPTLEQLLNDTDGKYAFAMYLQAKPLLDQINNLMNAVKVDTVTSSTIQDAIQVTKKLDKGFDSPFFKEMADSILETSVQGIYSDIKEFQAKVLEKWFPVRAFDFSNVTDNYSQIEGNDIKFAGRDAVKKFFRKMTHHFVSYIYQNANTTSFDQLRNGTSKILYGSNIEFTDKIDVPVLYAKDKLKIIINLNLLEKQFESQKKKGHGSYESKNGVRFTEQGNFIIHEINKAIYRISEPDATEEQVADAVLVRSMANEVLFSTKSSYNIANLFANVKEEAESIADSDLINKIKVVTKGTAVGLNVGYSLVDAAEYKEDIRKLSEQGGRLRLFFKKFSERIALQDNFESYEGSLMPYVLDKDLAEALSMPLEKFAELTTEQKNAEVNSFYRRFVGHELGESYTVKMTEPDPNAGKTWTDGTLNYRISTVRSLKNGTYEVSLYINDIETDGMSGIVVVKTDDKGRVIELDPKFSVNQMSNLWDIELGEELPLQFEKTSPQTTTLSEEELLELMKQCKKG